MDMPNIDWNEVWRVRFEERNRARGRNSGFWDKRANGFARHALWSDYVQQFLKTMNPEPGCTVLDVGSATGTLAIPLAGIVKSVTAMDPAPLMYENLVKRCSESNLTNIRPVRAGWEDDWEALGIGGHDIAIASRSLIVADLRTALTKLNRIARKKVFISTLVDDGPHDRRVFAAVGRDFVPGVDYITVYNLLRQMGIPANVSFTVHHDKKTYGSLDEAMERMRWMLHDMTPEEEGRLREHLQTTLIPSDGKVRMPYQQTVRWAVMWWEKDISEGEGSQRITPGAQPALFWTNWRAWGVIIDSHEQFLTGAYTEK